MADGTTQAGDLKHAPDAWAKLMHAFYLGVPDGLQRSRRARQQLVRQRQRKGRGRA